MKRKIKHWLTSDGPTSAKYQQRADRITNVMGWVYLGVAVMGLVVLWFIVKHPYTSVSKPIEGLSILHR